VHRQEAEDIHTDDLTSQWIRGARVGKIVVLDWLRWVQESADTGGVEGDVKCGIVDDNVLKEKSVIVQCIASSLAIDEEG